MPHDRLNHLGVDSQREQVACKPTPESMVASPLYHSIFERGFNHAILKIVEVQRRPTANARENIIAGVWLDPHSASLQQVAKQRQHGDRIFRRGVLRWPYMRPPYATRYRNRLIRFIPPTVIFLWDS